MDESNVEVRVISLGSGVTYECCVCKEHGLERCNRCCYDWLDLNEQSRQEALLKLPAKCSGPDCTNEGTKLCTGCRQVNYCSQNCQRNHWRVHKPVCGTKKRQQINLSCEGYPDEIVDVLPRGTRVTFLTGRESGDLRGKVIAFHEGKGPYKDPMVKYDAKKYKGYDPDSCMCSYTVQFDDGRTENIGASDLYQGGWDIELPAGEEGRNIGKAAVTSTVVDNCIALPTKISFPDQPKILLVSGLMFEAPSDCFYFQSLSLKLRVANIVFESINFDVDSCGSNLLRSLASGEYSACVIFGFCAGGPNCFKWFDFNPQLRQFTQNWVQAGGRLIIQGEGLIARLYQQWFGKQWFYSRYERTTSGINPSVQCYVPAAVRAELPHIYCVKATTLTHVAEEDQLYSYESGGGRQCVVAAAGFGAGRIGYIGDVNGEESTLRIITTLCIANGFAAV